MDTAVYSMLIIHIFMKILGCYYDTSVNTRHIIFMRTYLMVVPVDDGFLPSKRVY
jgi:hypothetical protein